MSCITVEVKNGQDIHVVIPNWLFKFIAAPAIETNWLVAPDSESYQPVKYRITRFKQQRIHVVQSILYDTSGILSIRHAIRRRKRCA